MQVDKHQNPGLVSGALLGSLVFILVGTAFGLFYGDSILPYPGRGLTSGLQDIFQWITVYIPMMAICGVIGLFFGQKYMFAYPLGAILLLELYIGSATTQFLTEASDIPAAVLGTAVAYGAVHIVVRAWDLLSTKDGDPGQKDKKVAGGTLLIIFLVLFVLPFILLPLALNL